MGAESRFDYKSSIYPYFLRVELRWVSQRCVDTLVCPAHCCRVWFTTISAGVEIMQAGQVVVASLRLKDEVATSSFTPGGMRLSTFLSRFTALKLSLQKVGLSGN